MTNEAINKKKGEKSSGKNKDKKKLNSEAMKELREKQAVKSEDKKAKKGELVVMKGFEILPPLKPEERKGKAQEIDAEVRSFDKEVNSRGLKMGIMLREMKGYELWKELKNKKGQAFTSFDAWLKEAAPISRSGGYAQLKVADKLLPLIPKDELAQYPDYARKLIAKVPKIHLEKIDSPIRKAARNAKSEKDVTDAIKKHAPEAHVENGTKVKFTVDDSARQVIGDGFTAAMEILEVPHNEVLEAVLTDWMDSPCQRPDCAGMSNREAWEHLKQRKAASAVQVVGEDSPQAEAV